MRHYAAANGLKAMSARLKSPGAAGKVRQRHFGLYPGSARAGAASGGRTGSGGSGRRPAGFIVGMPPAQAVRLSSRSCLRTPRPPPAAN
jgi:hypothetical protein